MRTLLCLEDVLEDNPQTRSLLRLFEEDANILRNYTDMLKSGLMRVVNAQAEMTLAVSSLSSILASYKDQNFPLDQTEYDMPSVTTRLHQILSEVASWNELMTQQLTNCVLFPVEKLSKELNFLPEKYGDHFHQTDAELDDVLTRFAKIHRKDMPRKIEELNNDVFFAKGNFHDAALKYFSRLNSLQFLRYTHTIEPLLSMLYAWRSFFHMGNEALNQADTTDFFTRTQEQIQSIHGEYKEETSRMSELVQTVKALRKIEPDMYYGEPTKEMDFNLEPTMSHKRGYLFLKSKVTLLTRWERCFFFTQGTQLMSQGRDDLGGQLLVDLSCPEGEDPPTHPVAAPATNEDRRFTIQLTCRASLREAGASGGGKGKVYIFQAQNKNDCLEWITVLNNMASAPQPDLKKQQHRDTKERESREESSSSSSAPASPPIDIPGAETPTAAPPSSPATLPKTENDLAPVRPISFDILSSGAEPKLNEVPRSRSQPVRFLGSMEVVTDRGDKVVHETMRQIMAARATHSIFKMSENRLVIDESGRYPRLLLVEPGTNEVKVGFQLQDLAYWTNHPENERLFAFIVRARAPAELRVTAPRARFTCFVFEAVNSGEEACKMISDGTKKAFQALLKRKTTEEEAAGDSEGSSTEASGQLEGSELENEAKIDQLNLEEKR